MEVLLADHQVSINKIICSNYAKYITSNDSEKNICQLGMELVEGSNINEVLIIPKTTEKKGFFERLFYLFK